MDFLVLTKVGGPFGVIVQVLGWIMEILFAFTNLFGVVNIGLSIILFTLVTKLILFPLSLNQQKSSKIQAVIQPEIQAIQKKYKGKNDNDSMMKMNVETRAVYEKYGASMTGGCLPLLIQFPIMIGLYQVIYKIPAYVGMVREYFETIMEKLPANFATNEVFLGLAQKQAMANADFTDADKVVDLLYKLTKAQWTELAGAFPQINDAVIKTGENAIVAVNRMQNFLGINVSYTPMNVITGFFGGNQEFGILACIMAILIPILSGLSQWYCSKLMTASQPQQADDAPGSSMMKSLNITMPIMSLVFCFTLPLVIGIYWVVSSLFQMGQQIYMNAYMSKIDVDELIRKNVEKANKKRAKKGLPPNKPTTIAQAMKAMQEAEEKEKAEQERKAAKTKKLVEDSTAYYNQNAKPGSLASKVNMVQKYNEKHEKH